MVDANFSFENDYKEYLNFIKKRPLISDSSMKIVEKNVYELLYIFSILIPNFERIDSKSHIYEYISQTKNNLIISFDLLNMNYHSASKQILRSSIESFFRFLLSTQRYLEYKNNLENNIFETTETLRKLRSMIDTHKIGKMTFYTQDYFSTMIISDIIMSLNVLYSTLSENVHVNSSSKFSPHKYLLSYSIIDENAVSANLCIFLKVLTNFIIILYYLNKFIENPSFSKAMLLKIEYLADPEFIYILDKVDEI